MFDEYGRVGILLLVAAAVPVGAVVMSAALAWLKLRPQNPNPIKSDIYECGMQTTGDTWVRFNFRYYVFALLFVIFDIETVFLFPWAVAFRQVKLFGFVEAVIFILILLVGYVYAWRKKAMEWR